MTLNSIPPACVDDDDPFISHIPVGVEVQLSRNPANSTTDPAGMYRGATPIIPKGYMWSCPGRAASLGLGLTKRP